MPKCVHDDIDTRVGVWLPLIKKSFLFTFLIEILGVADRHKRWSQREGHLFGITDEYRRDRCMPTISNQQSLEVVLVVWLQSIKGLCEKDTSAFCLFTFFVCSHVNFSSCFLLLLNLLLNLLFHRNQPIADTIYVAMQGPLFLLLLFVSACLARGNATLVLRAEKAILEREATFNHSRAEPLFRALHPNATASGPMTAVRHPLAHGLRHAIYSKRHIAAARDPKEVRKRVGRALGKLPQYQRRAVLNFRSHDKDEPKEPVALPTELSDMIYKEAVYNHLCETLDEEKGTAVQLLAQSAAREGRADLIDYLIWLGADPNVPTANGLSLLYYAAFVYCRNLDVIDRLLFYDADKAWKDQMGRPLLYHALVRDRLDVVRRLIDRETVLFRYGGEPTTFLAAMHNNVELLNLLFQYGADKEWTDDRGRSLLSYAVAFEAHRIVEMILQDGDNASGERDGKSLLEIAVQGSSSNCDMIALLLRYGANPIDSRGQHVLLETVRSGYLTAIKAQALFENGVYARHQGATDALLHVLLDGNSSVASTFLEYGADPNGLSADVPLLCHLLRRQDFDSADLLFEYGANVNIRVFGKRLLQMPVLYEKPAVAEWLKRHGAY